MQRIGWNIKLSDAEVADRTNTTIKLANVSRQSAEDVSDQLTAIWNNFDNGSKSLEYYADVITALGASTASSSQEISEGLNKFAATAGQVGLSYEYATAALATITAKTRESADVVGTALNTLFGRLQGLSLGETLDDGTDLNKYSKALYAVGVNIKDTNNNLKDMDTILDELASKWGNLAEDQQIALAETIGGVRQYRQVLALMNNWDFMQENLLTAQMSEGTLQKQADIYAESWEASSKRVKTALETIYTDLIDENFMIGINNDITKVLGGVDSILKSLGGFKGVLLVISNILINQFSGELTQGLQKVENKFHLISDNIKNFKTDLAETTKLTEGNISAWDRTRIKIEQIVKVFDTSQNFQRSLSQTYDTLLGKTGLSNEMRDYLVGLKQIQEEKAKFLSVDKYMNDIERDLVKTSLEQLAIYNDELRVGKEKIEDAQELLELYHTMADVTLDTITNQDSTETMILDETMLDTLRLTEEQLQRYVELVQGSQTLGEIQLDIDREHNSLVSISADYAEDLYIFNNSIVRVYEEELTLQRQLANLLSQSSKAQKNGLDIIDDTKIKMLEILEAKRSKIALDDKEYNELVKRINALDNNEKSHQTINALMSSIVAKSRRYSEILGADKHLLDNVVKAVQSRNTNEQKVNNTIILQKQTMEELATQYQNILEKKTSFSTLFTGAIQGASGLAMNINMIRSSWQQLNSEDADGFSKFASTLMLIGTGGRLAWNTLNQLSNSIKTITMITEGYNAVKKADMLLDKEKIATDVKSIIYQEGKIKLSEEENKKRLAAYLQKQLGLNQEQAQIKADEIYTALARKKNGALGQTITNQEMMNILGEKDIVITDAETAALMKQNAEKQQAIALEALHKIAVAATVVAITALIIGFYKLSTAEDEQSKTATRLSKAQEKLKESAEDAKTAADDLRSTFDSYESARKSLSECTQGTEEWTEALKEANKAAKELLNNLPSGLTADEIVSLYSIDENGRINIDSSAISKLQSQLDYNANAAQYSANAGDVQTDTAYILSRIRSELVEGILVNTVGLDRTYAVSLDQTYADNGATVYTPTDEDYSRIANTIYDNLDKLAASAFEDNAADFKTVLDSVGIASFRLSDKSLERLRSVLIELGEEADANAAKLKLYADLQVDQQFPNAAADEKVIISNVLAQQTEKFTQGYTDLLRGVTGGISDLIGSEWERVYGSVKSSGINVASEKNNQIYDFALNQLKKAGFDFQAVGSNAVRGTDAGNRELAFQVNGEIKTYTAEWIAQQIAASEALRNLTENATLASNVLSTINAGENGNAISNWIASGDFSNITQTEFDKLKSDINAANGVEEYFANLGLSPTEMQDIFGEGWQTLFQKALDSYETALRNTITAWGAQSAHTSEQAFKNMPGFDKITQAAQINFANAYRQIFTTGGLEATNIIDDILKVSGNKSSEAMEIIGSIDWTDYDSIVSLQEQLKALGITIDDNVIIELLNANQVAKSFSTSSFREELAKLQDVLKDLKIGDTIDKKDFEKYFSDYQDYFAIMADGSGKLLYDAEQFYNMVRANKIAEYVQTVQSRQNINNNNWEKLNRAGASLGLQANTATGNIESYLTSDQKKIDFAQIMGFLDETQVRNIKNKIKSARDQTDLDRGAYAELDSAIKLATDSYNQLTEAIVKNDSAIISEQSILFAEATSLDDLHRTANALTDSLGGYDFNAYATGLMSIATQYENATTELRDFQFALASGNENLIKQSQEALEISVYLGEAAEKFSLDAEILEMQAQQYATTLGLSSKAAADLAIQQQLLDRGIETLSKDWKDWKKTLSSADKSSTEYFKTVKKVTSAIADLIGVSQDLNLSPEFVSSTEVAGLLDKALTGDIKSVTKLGTKVAETMTKARIETSKWQEVIDAAKKSPNDFELLGEATSYQTKIDTLQKGFTTFFDELADKGFETGQELGGAAGIFGQSWQDAFNQLAADTGMTKQEMEDIFHSMDLSVDVTEKQVNLPHQIPTYETTETVTYDPNSDPWNRTYTKTSETKITGYKQVDEAVMVGQINTGEENAGKPASLTYTPPTNAALSSTKKSGGGSSKSKKTYTPKNDYRERYHEVNDAIDDITDALNRANKAADRFYGKDRLKAMDQQIKYLQQYNKTLSEWKVPEAEQYLVEDKAVLEEAAKDLGLSLIFDSESGNITNIEEEQLKAWNELHEIERQMIAEGRDDLEETAWQPLKDKWDVFKDALDQYEETRELREDLLDTIEENLDTIQQLNFDKITLKYQYQIEINNEDRKLLEWTADQQKDNIFTRIEYAVTMSGNTADNLAGDGTFSNSGILRDLTSNLDNYQIKLKELENAYATNQINQEQFIEGLRDCRDNIYNNLNELIAYDKVMGTMYAETVPMATKEIDKYTSSIEYCSEVLEHFTNLLNLTGRAMNYNAKGIVLEAQVNIMKNRFDAANAEYQFMQEQLQQAQADYAAVLAGNDEQAIQQQRENLDAITEATQQAYTERLEYAEQYAEALQNKMQNIIDKEYSYIENIITNNRGYDAMITQIDRLSSQSEEFLTSTQQAYEANKLLRTMQNDLNNTQNKQYQERIKLFMDETKALGEREQLSQHELEIQQKRYDLLLAQMALEDAQNAKTNLELQRDEQGNYTYVYTADQSKVNDLQQEYDDRYMDLYNLLLEGSEDYLTKYAKILQEKYETLQEIEEKHLKREYESEEQYNQDRLEAREYYDKQLTYYAEQYELDMLGLAADLNLKVDLENKKFVEDQITNYGVLKTGQLDLLEQLKNGTLERINLMYDSWTAGANAINGLIIGEGENGRASLKQAIEIYEDAELEAFQNIDDAMDEYLYIIDTEVAPVVGSDLEELATKTDAITTASENLVKELTGSNGVISALEETLIKVGDLSTAWNLQHSAIREVIDDYSDYIDKINNIESETVGYKAGGLEYDKDVDYASLMGQNYAKYQETGDQQYLDAFYLNALQRNAKIVGEGMESQYSTKATNAVIDFLTSGHQLSDYNQSYYSGLTEQDWIAAMGEAWWKDNKHLFGFATGGYTGEWGPEGKIALLHEKELVLNDTDTENILAVVNTVRDIINNVDSMVMAATNGMLNQAVSFSSPNNRTKLEQSVSIAANFPNVSDRNEIQEAINNLINQAAQYAAIRNS